MTTNRMDAIEGALVGGDLSKLSVEERLSYYKQLCESLGLNPLTKPFAFITLGGKLTLYALKDCTEQLRTKRKVSITDLDIVTVGDVYTVKAKARDAEGRTDIATGAVNINGLKGESLANAVMKAETKAKRRVTLSICGLGILDESEADSVPGALKLEVEEPEVRVRQLNGGEVLDTRTGEVFSEKSPEALMLEHDAKVRRTLEAIQDGTALVYDTSRLAKQFKTPAEKRAVWNMAVRDYGAWKPNKGEKFEGYAFCAESIPNWEPYNVLLPVSDELPFEKDEIPDSISPNNVTQTLGDIKKRAEKTKGCTT